MIKYLCLLPIFFYALYRIKHSLHMFQQNTYKRDVHLNWLKKRISKELFSIHFIPLIFLPFLIIFNNILFYIIYFLIFTLIALYTYLLDKYTKTIKPLVITPRIIRQIITTTIVTTILTILFIQFNLNIIILATIFIYLYPILIIIINYLNKPIEQIVYLSYKNKAIKKLKDYNTEVIGITGSYGKTSSKNILSEILNIKYNALPTPLNYNTPYGLIITINNNLSKFDDFLIAEMGAKRVGEIKELCNLVKPKYGILTKIGEAHLETFKSIANIQKTKFELIDSLPKNGVAILNVDDGLQRNYKIKSNCKKIWIGIDHECDYQAKNIKISHEGTSFDLEINDKNYSFNTKLLGYANIYNILASIALGIEFNIKIEDLQRAVKRVKPVEHRLELKELSKDLYMIDDAYNSNPDGSKMALEVLNKMPGKKIIMTPGMVELGSKEYILNKEFGKQIATICDEVILIGLEQTKPIQDGLKVSKYPEDNIHILKDVKEGFNLLNHLQEDKTYVLVENDLPDIYK